MAGATLRLKRVRVVGDPTSLIATLKSLNGANKIG
jgi:hypothetical protein